MLDINFIRENKEKVAETVKNRGLEKSVDINKLLDLYQEYLHILKDVETRRALKNTLSEKIPMAGANEKEDLIKEASAVKEDLQQLEKDLLDKKNSLELMLMFVPNVVSNEMPVGNGEDDNKVLRVWHPKKGYLKINPEVNINDVSYMPKDDFAYKDHVELGEALNLIDVKQSAKVSGSRFCYLQGDLVILQDAISAFYKKELLRRNFRPLIPPLLVKERSLYGTSHFPRGREDVYKIENSNVEEKADLYLIGSSEPTNFSYFMDKTLEKKELPIKVYAQTPCFRSEVGSWGKDVKGIKRVHQFDKLEMNAVTTSEQAMDIFNEFIEINEWFYQQIKVPYRIINKCTGDCGYDASFLQYDVEAWRPGEKTFMEVGTDTYTTDYQARRLSIKYRDGDALKYVHTINDTGIPFGRVLIVILENYQCKDGSIEIPKVLQKYTGFKKITPKKPV